MNTALLKLRTTRTPWAAAGVIVAAAAAVLALNAALLGRPGQPALTPEVLVDLVRAPGRLTGAAALLFGLLLTTSEYRHGTALSSRLVQPRTTVRLLGAAVAAAVAGAVLAGIVTVLMLGGSAAILASADLAVEPFRHGTPAAVAALVVTAALHGIAGVGLGELLRNPAAAVGVVLGWIFVVEGIVPVVLRQPDFGRWLPGGAIQSALEPSVGGVALLAVYAVAVLALGGLRASRDA